MASKTIRFTLNGRTVVDTVAANENVVDLLRRHALFGARESCGQGLCGCCTVLLDGLAVSGCLQLAQLVEGRKLVTIEHLDDHGRGELTVVQQAFIDEGAFQCGFCTPGFVLMTQQLLAANPNPSDGEIRDYLSGNLCRCAAYPEIIKAVHSAAARMRVERAYGETDETI